MDRPISSVDVLLAIRKKKNERKTNKKQTNKRKAAGPDGLLGEFPQFAGDEDVNILTKLFNTLFDKGVFSQDLD